MPAYYWPSIQVLDFGGTVGRSAGSTGSFVDSTHLCRRSKKGRPGLTVCWYFRPEQTFHPEMRQFWENEIFKTSKALTLTTISRHCLTPAPKAILPTTLWRT